MPPEEFRRFGHELVDWIANYLAHPEAYPVMARTQPGDLIDALPPAGPEQGEPMEAILEDFRTQIVPAVTHWNHPGFMAYFAISASGPGILGEMLTAALNQNGMLWKTSPASTELEQVTLGWLRGWMGLPQEFFGVIHDTASTGTMHAIAAARHVAIERWGAATGLRLYTSEHAHSSVEKGALALGLEPECIRKIGVDEEFRMRTDLLEQAIQIDCSAGLRPFCLVPTIGATSTASIDPVAACAALARRHGMWLHVDAAYGGAAAIVPEFQYLLDGAAAADSLVVNPHKWLLTPLDLSVLYTRRPEVFRRAFSLVPEYLRSNEDPRAVNFMEYGVPLGRRFRALKLWFVMRHYGREGLANIIRSHVLAARELAAQIDQDPDFERMAPTPLSLVCFRRRASNERNRQLLEAVNASGEAFLSHTTLNGKLVLRLAVGNMATTRQHVQRAWELIRSL